MTDNQINILRHTVGADSESPGYRNRYCCESDNKDLLSLVALGFMEGPKYIGHFGEGNGMFYATEKTFKLLGIKESK